MVAKPSRLIILVPIVAIALFAVALYLRHFSVLQGQGVSRASIQSPVNFSLKDTSPTKSQQANLSSVSNPRPNDIGETVGDSLLKTNMVQPKDLRP